MSNYNKIILCGNVGKDPVIKKDENGKTSCNFSLAVTSSEKNKVTNQYEKVTDWYNVVVYSDFFSKHVEMFVEKGTVVLVEGKLKFNHWTDKAGIERTSPQVYISQFEGEVVAMNRTKKRENPYLEGVEDENSDKKVLDDDELPF